LVAETAPNNQDIVTKTVLVKSTEIVTVIQLPGNTTYGPTYGWKQSAQVKTTGVIATPIGIASSNFSLTAVNSSARLLTTPTATLDSTFFSRGSLKSQISLLQLLLTFATALYLDELLLAR
jgi:hypothetical protein